MSTPSIQDRISGIVAGFWSHGWECDIPVRQGWYSDGEYLSVLKQKFYQLEDKQRRLQSGDIGYRHPYPPSQIEWDGDH